MKLKLYTRYINSAGQRVRTALNIKGVDYEYVPVTLDDGPPEAYGAVNPQALLPSLEVDGRIVTQSTALIEFIEETFDGPSLFPEDPVNRACARAFGQVIACEMHALGVGRVLKHLKTTHGQGDADGDAWYTHWSHKGYETLEALLHRRKEPLPFTYDDKPTVGDIYLVPKLYNARLRKLDLSPYPLLTEIDERCRALPAFDKAMPENQPDHPG